MRSIRSVIASHESGTLLYRVRRRRFKHFTKLVNTLGKPLRIIDAGGEVSFWKKMGCLNSNRFSITLLNICKMKLEGNNIKYIKESATNLNKITDLNKYDLIFSNSMIEHMSHQEQIKFAKQVRDSKLKYYIQTPNKNFPIEPHFIFPFFQFLPKWLRIILITNFSLGFFDKTNKKNAIEIIDSINMLSLKEIKKLFPQAKVYKEKNLFLDKSYTVFWGF